MLIEALGILASILIICAFMFKDIRIIRILDAIGAALYILYGVLIHSFPNILLNLFLVIIQIYHLIKLSKEKNSCFQDSDKSELKNRQ